MDVFRLRDSIIHDYSSYIGSFIQIQDARINQTIKKRTWRRSALARPALAAQSGLCLGRMGR